jgi:hypothetical protein
VSAGQLNLTVEQGAAFRHTLYWLDADRRPVDLTGYSARMHVRRSERDPATLLELTTENGRIAFAEGAAIVLTLPSEVTAAITWGRARYDLVLTGPDGEATRLVEGFVNVSRGITR